MLVTLMLAASNYSTPAVQGGRIAPQKAQDHEAPSSKNKIQEKNVHTSTPTVGLRKREIKS